MDPSLVGDYITSLMNDRFVLVSTITFFICEGVFNAFPIHHNRFKQLVSLLIGSLLGLFFIEATPIMAAVQGLLAGGATTITVGKFKKPSQMSMPVVSAREGDTDHL